MGKALLGAGPKHSLDNQQPSSSMRAPLTTNNPHLKKQALFALFAIFALSCLADSRDPSTASAQPAASVAHTENGSLTLTVGDVSYQNAILKKEYPKSVFIQHDSGSAFIDRKQLTPDQLAQLMASSSKDAASKLKGDMASGSAGNAAPSIGVQPPTETFDINVAGSKVEVVRMGTGPTGVIFFGNSASEAMKKTVLSTPQWFADLVPEKCSFFLWAYPESAPFDQVQPAIRAYMQGDKDKVRPDFKGIASNVVSQIREKTGLGNWLLVGNSLGAGVLLWDYTQLVEDPKISFLLVSPTETFMPPVSGLGKLERTMVLAAKGWKNDGEPPTRTDSFLKGEEAWDWVAKNLDVEAVDQITKSSETEPEIVLSKPGETKSRLVKKTDFSIGHKIIGEHINNELLAKIIKVKLGIAEYGILAEQPKQRD